MTLTDGRSPRRSEVVLDPLPVHEQLRARARRDPDRPALTDGARVLTAAELDRRLDAIAAHLHRHGVTPGDRIVLHAERSLDVVVVLLGIHRAGAAYVPVDPDLPAARVAMLLEDASPALVLTDRPMPVAPTVASRAIDEVLAAPPALVPVRPGSLDDPAHVIFTSGSTGRPKGVAVGQRALAAFVDAVNEHYDIRPEDRVLQFSSLSFDGSVQEIFVPLAHGATVVVPPRPLLGAAGWVVDELARLGITWMAMPTSAWHALASDLDLAGFDLPAGLRSVMVGGEAARPEVVLRWQAGAGRGRRLINSYGPTEVTVASVVTELAPGALRPGEAVPIGVPLTGVHALVVGEDDRPVVPGQIGELLLGGPQLADGYLGRPELTAARFVPDPTGRPGLVYRTGDRVRTRDDGLLVFEGRVDDQVKIRGFRIELAEIDAAFASHPGVVDAVTVVDRSLDEARLATFVVASVPDVAALRAHVALVLPPYAVPAVIERCASIPRTTGHKPDRLALRARLAAASSPTRAPLTFTPERLWALEQLDVPTRTHPALLGRRLRGPFDAGAFEGAVRDVTARHEPLRTRIVRTPSGPVQEIDLSAPVRWERRDLGAVAPAARDDVLRDAYLGLARAPLDVERGPSCEWVLLRLADDDHAVFVRVHHLVLDAPSVDLLFDDVVTAYGARVAGNLARQAPPLVGEPVVDRQDRRDPTGVEAVRACFADVLGRRVGDDDDFFASGGHSLLAVRLCSALERTLGVRLELATVFDAPTPRRLAAYLDNAHGTSPAAVGAPDTVLARPVRLWLERAPASSAQRRMWLLETRGALVDAYLLTTAHVVDGPLDVAALRAAAATTAHRHEVLRTRLVEGAGASLEQVVDPVAQDVVEVVDRRDSGLDADECLARARDHVRRPFDLGRDHPWRVVVIAVAQDRHVVVLVVHHVATDGASQQLLHRDLAAAYRAAITGAAPPEPPALQYADHAVWQHAARARGAFAASLARATAALVPAPEPLRVPAVRRRGTEATGPGGVVARPLDDAVLAAIDRLAASLRTTRVAVLLTAYEVLLHRLTGRTELVVGIPVTERSSDVYDGTMGFFVNTAAVRSALADDTDARTAVHATHHALHAAIRDADAPFELVVDALDVAAEPGVAPLVQTMFSVQLGDLPLTLDGLEVRAVRDAPPAEAKFDLSLVVHLDESPRLVLEHRVDLLDPPVVAAWAERYVDLLTAMAADPGARLWDLPMVDEVERRRLAAEERRGRTPYPADASVHELVDAVAAVRGDEVAVVDGDRTRTYADLVADSHALATRLRAAGVAPGGRVAVELPRSYDLVVAMLAVLRCGAAYVPVDPANPDRRRALVRELADPVATVAREGGAVAVAPTGRGVDAGDATGARAPAYVMFTSGSTGNPKGVVVPHRAIVRLVRDTDYVDLGPDVVMAHLSNTSFDAATFEIWGALCNGGRLVVLDADTATSPGALGAAVRAHGITTMFLTTALFNAVAREEPAALRSLRDLLFGGEEADVAAVRRVLAHGAPARLVNAYGPTESTTFAAWHLVTAVPDDADHVPIGSAIANTTLHVVDRHGAPVPPYVAGELWIGGDGLALGYLGDEELTARRFGPDPFSSVPGARIYRTGDLVRRRSDGTIEFLGRLDDQVKVRGFRVEPGEIEAALRAHDGVSTAHVLVRRDTQGVASLHAFVVPGSGHVLDADDLRTALAAQLPAALVPESVHVLDELPINANGKVDRDALGQLVRAARRSDTRPAERVTDPIVRRLISVWSDALGEPVIGPDDDFFRLGGTSIRAVRVIASVERELGVRVGLSSLFLAPTPRTLAAHVRASGDAAAVTRPVQAADEALVVPLRECSGPVDAVMCCIYPAGGQLYSYARLTRLLPPSVEVLGVRELGWGAPRAVYRTVEEYAAHYATEIDAARPNGPLVVLGYSLGGLLAYETARCLEARGRRVELVVLLDAIAIDAPSLSQLPKWIWNRRMLGSRVRFRDAIERRRTTRAGRPLDPRLLGRESERRGFGLQERYRPGPYDGRVLCLRARGAGPTPTPDTFTHRWARVASALEIVEVSGEHTGEDSLLSANHVADVAAVIRRALGH